MKTILIDARTISWPGIGRYVLNLLVWLEPISEKHKFVVLMQKKDFHVWSPRKSNFSRVECNIKPYSFSEQVLLPYAIFKEGPDLVHFPAPNSPIGYVGSFITTIHDLTLTEFKNVRNNPIKYELIYWAFRAVLSSAAKRSRYIITPTKYVQKEVMEKYGRPKSNIYVTYEGVTLHDDKKIFEDNQKFILCVGSFYPHKNLGRLIDSFNEVKNNNPSTRLVFVGKNNFYTDQLKKRVDHLGLNGSIEFKGFVSDDELAKLYQNAALYVFPSLSEGFGLPGLEAMSYGTPVSSSNATCLPEVYGDAAVYFDPTSVDDIARVISETLNDKELLAKLRKAGPEHAKKFSWEKMARETLEVYEKALKR